MKAFQGWKTVSVGIIIAVLGVLQQSGIEQVVPAQYSGLVLAGIGAVMVALRSVTTTPLGQKTPTP